MLRTIAWSPVVALGIALCLLIAAARGKKAAGRVWDAIGQAVAGVEFSK